MLPIKTLLLVALALLLAATPSAPAAADAPGVASVSIDGVKKTNPLGRFASKIKGRIQDGRRKKKLKKLARKLEQQQLAEGDTPANDEEKIEDPATAASPEGVKVPPRLSDTGPSVLIPAVALMLLVLANLRHSKSEEARLRHLESEQSEEARRLVRDASLIKASASALDLTVATENDTDSDSSSDMSSENDDDDAGSPPSTPPPSPRMVSGTSFEVSPLGPSTAACSASRCIEANVGGLADRITAAGADKEEEEEKMSIDEEEEAEARARARRERWTSHLEAKRAKRLDEQAAAADERARMEARAQAEEAEKARVESQARRAEGAEKARIEAKALAEAEKARKEAEEAAKARKQREEEEDKERELDLRASKLLAIMQEEAAVMAREAEEKKNKAIAIEGEAEPLGADQEESNDDEADSEDDSDDEDEDWEDATALFAALEAEAAARAREAEEAIDAAECAVERIDPDGDGNASARELRMSLRRSSSMLQFTEC